MPNVSMIPVDSSNLKAIGYENGSIIVEFQRGDKYSYSPATQKDFNDGISAVKVSDWFNKFKTGKTFKKL